MNRVSYFDNAATTMVLKSASDATLNCMNKIFANPSSLHKLGLEAEKIITSAKKTLANILNCSSGELIFTPSATISTNIALLGSLNFKKLSKLNRLKILTTKIEHAATKNCLKELQNRGFQVVEISPTNKIYTAQSFADECDDSTCLISIMHVNNENGLILPIEEISNACKIKNNNVLIHLDCAQSFAKLPINLAKIQADFVSISGHKINAPKGVGALFIKRTTNLKPILFGGNQQNRLCPGTENVPAIAGFEVAAKFHQQNMKANFEHYRTLQNKLIEILANEKNISFNFEKNFNSPHITNISIKGIRSQIMLNFLDSKGFFVSSGSACSKGKTSSVLTNLNYGTKKQDSAIRISFSVQNSIDEIEKLAQTILIGIKTIQKTN